MLDLRYVKKLVEMLDESSLDSIEISTEKGLKIRISKAASQPAAVAVATPQSVPIVLPVSTADLRQTPAGGVPVAVEAPPPAEPVALLTDVKSPMVGTFYVAPEPGAKPFVTVGSRVSKGQVLCIIEAMKIMNEIESEHAGIVRQVAVTDAHPVEFGEVLFRIDPNG